jgi:hypothetical protein
VPDPSTTRLALYKSLSDGSELVSYTQDIGQNLDKLDAAAGFQVVTSSTRPSSPYSGKPITQSDTSYSTFFSNGTAPASASWVEIPNGSSTFGSNLKLASGSQLTIGADVNLFRNAANVLRTNDALIVDGATTLSSTLGVTGATTLSSTLAVTGVVTTTTHLSVGGDLKLVGGTTTHRNALTVAAGITVANTTTETAVGTMTIPAGDAVAGAIYRARVIANVSFLASAQLTWRVRLGGVAGTAMATAGPTTLSGTGQTNKEAAVEVDLVCATTGASGTWFCMLQEVRNTQDTGSVGASGPQLGSSDGTIVRDTTAANDLVITAQWAAASASNTLTARVIFERIA